MNASAPHQADGEQISRFVDALFRYADEGGFVSLRAFYDDANEVFSIEAHGLTGTLEPLVAAATAMATRAARAARPVVFAPPIATFSTPRNAAEADLQNGLALSVECDQKPAEARRKLEAILGPATIAVASGGEWPDPETGVLEPKLHLHWRLTEPTRDEDGHARLKRCRSMASDLVGGDGTNKPAVHPIRWPGSWHRKAAARLARIVAQAEAEVDLDEAEQRLRDAWQVHQQEQAKAGKTTQEEPGTGEPRETSELVAAILTGADYHAPITALAMRLLKGGTPDAQVVLLLRGFMQAVPEAVRDTKDGIIQKSRWQARYDDIPRAVSTARAEINEKSDAAEAEQPTPQLWYDVAPWDGREIPKRPWVAPGYLMRGSVSVLSGQGAGGKSSLVVAWTIALAAGEAVGEFKPVRPMVVVNYNTEDDRDEQQRRYSAALIASERDGAGLMPRIVRCGPSDLGTLFERNADTGRIVATAAMQELEVICAENRADVLVCDPLAELHNVEENDNTAMRSVIAAFRSLAKRLGIAVLVLHHDRKGNSTPGDMDRVRGASAISGAVRVMLTLTTMSVEEADKLGIEPEDRRRHFRIDGAKSNYAPTQEAEWWRLSAHEIPNGEHVAACLPWKPPTAFGDLTVSDCVSVLMDIHRGTDAGHAYAATKQAKDDWAGRILMDRFDKTEGQAATIIASWVSSGVLVEGMHDGPRRGHQRKAFSVNLDIVSEMRGRNRGGP